MKTSDHCRGCYCDRYNHPGLCERPGIDAPVTSKKCWMLAKAKLVTRFAIGTNVPMNIRGAYRKVKVPDCYHQNGTAYINAIPDYAE